MLLFFTSFHYFFTLIHIKNKQFYLIYFKHPKSIKKAMDNWCSLVSSERAIRAVKSFTKTLIGCIYGIINDCKFPIYTSRKEGFNNKIKIIDHKV
ncbi:MAG: transposase [Thermodesulfovibrionales bacterium]|nr:transposase [Thermodesulfovibrionales bacterium]